MANIVFKPNQQNYSITNLGEEAKHCDLSPIKVIQSKLENLFDLETIHLTSDVADELYHILDMVDAVVEQEGAI